MRLTLFCSRFLTLASSRGVTLACALGCAIPTVTGAQGSAVPAAPPTLTSTPTAPPSTPVAPPAKSDAGASEFKEIKWEALVPKDWDPTKRFKSMNLGMLDDRDPRVVKAMREMRETFDNAPTIGELDGASIKLPGYVVPLEEVKGELKEFLLVPYFGACIHTPPPPANQIVHVTVTKPLKGLRSMDTVWVSGVLKTARQDSSMGTSGYRMTTVVLERYVAGERR